MSRQTTALTPRKAWANLVGAESEQLALNETILLRHSSKIGGGHTLLQW